MISCKCDCTQAPPAKVVEESSSEEESSDEEPGPKKAAPIKAAVPTVKAESFEERSSEEESDDEDEVRVLCNSTRAVQDLRVLVHASQKRWLEDMANRMMAWSLLQTQALKLVHDRIMMLDLAKPWWLHFPQPTCACMHVSTCCWSEELIRKRLLRALLRLTQHMLRLLYSAPV